MSPKKDAEKTARELIARGKEEKQKLDKLIDDQVKIQLEKLGYIKKSELEDLVKKEVKAQLKKKEQEE